MEDQTRQALVLNGVAGKGRIREQETEKELAAIVSELYLLYVKAACMAEHISLAILAAWMQELRVPPVQLQSHKSCARPRCDWWWRNTVVTCNVKAELAGARSFRKSERPLAICGRYLQRL